MKLEELFEYDSAEGGYPEKKPPRDKTKTVSKLIRRKADKNNPDREDTEIGNKTVKDTAEEPSIQF